MQCTVKFDVYAFGVRRGQTRSEDLDLIADLHFAWNDVDDVEEVSSVIVGATETEKAQRCTNDHTQEDDEAGRPPASGDW